MCTIAIKFYTLERSFRQQGGIDGKVVGMMGDLKRGRTVRSLCYLMKNYHNVKLVFIAPPPFLMEDDIKSHLQDNNVEFLETENLMEMIGEIDALYVTRIQDEHDRNGESKLVDMSKFKFGPEQLKSFKSDGVIMHPLPRRDEIDTVIDNDPRAKYWRQERNGMWMRVAILAKIFQVHANIVHTHLRE